MFIAARILLTIVPVYSLLIHDPCKVGWLQYQNICYMFSVAKENWYNAELFCRAMGGHLAEIHTSDVNDFLKNHLKLEHMKDHNGTHFWIGLTDIAHATQWIWENSGDAPVFTDWGTGQPVNNNEHCGFLYGIEAYKWHDADCDEKHFFICQSI